MKSKDTHSLNELASAESMTLDQTLDNESLAEPIKDLVPDDAYPQPAHGWTCYHCGETFTTWGSAEDHFGRTQGRKAGCLIKVELGDERGWLMELRKLEEEIAVQRKAAYIAEARVEMLEGEIQAFRCAAGVRSSHELRMLIDSMQGRVITANALIEAFQRTCPELFGKVIG